MNRSEREQREAQIGEITKSTCARFDRKAGLNFQDEIVNRFRNTDATLDEIQKYVAGRCQEAKARDRSFSKSVADTLAATPTPVDFDADLPRANEKIEGLQVFFRDEFPRNSSTLSGRSTNATEASAGEQPVNRWRDNLSMLDLARPGALDDAIVPVSTPEERVSFAKELVGRHSAALAAKDLAPAVPYPTTGIEGRLPGDK